MQQLAQKCTPMPTSEPRDPSKAAERGDKPTRRRSHRPRGCRGGSNRRKNKGGENRNSVNKPKRGLTKKQGSLKNQRSSFNKGSNASTSLNTLSVMTGHAPTNLGQQMGTYAYDRALSLQEYGVPPADMYYSSNSSSSSDLYPSGTDLQESLSESSEEGIPNPNSRSFHFDPNEGGLILPPMVVPNVHEAKPEALRGPNPYALHPSSHHNISDPRLAVFGMYNSSNSMNSSINNTVQAPEAHDMKKFYNQGNGCSENQAHSDLLAIQLRGLETKVAQFSKQQPLRQVRASGSLFCTSPRSFLMGKKNTDGTTRSE